MHDRVDSIIIPRNMFFYHAKSIDPDFVPTDVEIIKPAYKVYDMYVAFSKLKPNYKQLTADFNKGLKIIKKDGSYDAILKKHNVSVDTDKMH